VGGVSAAATRNHVSTVTISIKHAAASDHCVALVQLDDHKQDEQNKRAHELCANRKIGPSPMISFDERERCEKERTSKAQHTRQIESRCGGVFRCFDELGSERYKRRSDGWIYAERPLPTERLRDQPADDGTGGHADADYRSPKSEGSCASFTLKGV
jgi:hypothetical protein